MGWGRDWEEKRQASVMCPYLMVKGLFILTLSTMFSRSSQSEAQARKLQPEDLVTHIYIFLFWIKKKKILN